MIVTRYLSKEIFSTLSGVLAVLLLIFASKHFVRYLSQAAAGEIPTDVIFKVLAYFLISSLVFILPFALFISVLVALGRMYQDSEITALEACGIGLPRILRSITILASIFAVGVATLSLWVAPWAERQQALLQEKARAEAEIGLVSAGRFHPIMGGSGVFYAEDVSPKEKKLKNVFIQVQGGQKLDVFSANAGSLTVDRDTGDRFVLLEDGFRYEWLPNDEGYRIYEYEQAGIRIYQQPLMGETRARGAIPTSRLWGSDDRRYQSELQWRLSMPISAVLLAVIAVLISRTTPRQGRFSRLFVALILYALYFNMMTVSQSWLYRGVIPPVVGIWWVHVVMAIVILLLLSRQLRIKRFFHHRSA